MATILVVDDRPQNREFLTMLLEYRHHNVVESKDGAEALALARKVHPDLVISDVLMPVMDGYELARKLRSEPQLMNIPIVFWTAHYLEREARALAEKSGAVDILCKPCEPEDVLRVVDTALSSRSPVAVVDLEALERDHARLISNKLVAINEDARWARLRLASLVNAIHRLSLEREPADLIQLGCREVREIVGAASAIIGILPETGGELEHCYVRGAETRVDRAFCERLRHSGLIQNMLVQNKPFRAEAAHAKTLSFGPDDWPVTSTLGVPIHSGTMKYGFLCLLNKLGSDSFTEEDEQVARAIADQVALGYESGRLYSEVTDLNRRLKAEIEKLSQANADLEQFSYAIGHDLKEPLRTIYNFSELLMRRHAASSDEETREFTARIQSGVQRTRSMVDGLLAFARTSKSEVSAHGPIDPSGPLQDALRSCEASIAETNASIHVDQLPPVRADEAQLRLLFQNLVSNALKYRRPGAAPVIQIGGRRAGSEAEFAVRDNGIGIAPAQYQEIFVLFRRLHGEEYSGIGLGLALCARVVQRSGGKIWVESPPGGGSTFYFTLPAAD
jgi:signal transduction histidine kinase/DNA-binding response OmpR family regulator